MKKLARKKGRVPKKAEPQIIHLSDWQKLKLNERARTAAYIKALGLSAQTHGQIVFIDSCKTSRTHSTPLASNERAMGIVSKVFEFAELVAPKRVTDEEIGDALEVICRLRRERRPTWQIYVKLVATVFWVFAHAARDVVKGPAGQKASAKKR